MELDTLLMPLKISKTLTSTQMNNYYSLLGITPEADIKLIKAAYKIMSNKYHPDKYQGADATEKMQLINEAYATLSDTSKRQAFDEQWGESNNFNSAEPEENDCYAEFEKSSEADWSMAVEIYPELTAKYDDLHKISQALATSFKVTMLEHRNFELLEQVAEQLKNNFITRYFGNNIHVQNLALDYISDGNREAARELNKLAVFFGQSIDFDRVEQSVVDKFGEPTFKVEEQEKYAAFKAAQEKEKSEILGIKIISLIIMLLTFVILSR
ncbi:J domain-containing protein [Vibrio sp. SCSIO 43136]|uniref:J domain-containing protein n=1 Tax=Vibrio sp. SCSIO 43136 TaxID=2819101 RepID=UPI002074C232|nr:J domain-containing protein [Vibrio sp. SCSIO 43136]USD67372.1 DnaJ domain-containing protein [Vibrio sp. SCSIO 43136]